MAGKKATYGNTSIAVFLLITLAHNCKGQNAYIVYLNEATSERSLPVCNNPRTACNIIHKRFWMTPLVKRLCKCPDFTECPQEWSQDADHTVMLNSRAQMKFCGQVGNLPNCRATETAMAIENYNTSSGPRYNIEVNCYCPGWHYFNRQHIDTSKNNEGNMVRKEHYKCQLIEECATGEFCGHITADFYETYYKCSCPKKDICIMNERRRIYASEALYNGLAYRGICTYYEP